MVFKIFCFAALEGAQTFRTAGMSAKVTAEDLFLAICMKARKTFDVV